jgi:hypothetical protein
MPDLLIRNVTDADLQLIREAAAQEGISMQSYMLRNVQRHATYLRRQATLATLRSERGHRAPISDEDRAVIRKAMYDAFDELGERHADRLAP